MTKEDALDRRLNEALAVHRSGRTDEAEAAYRTILNDHPDHPEAQHLLGLALHQQGRNDDALPWLRGACAASPGEIGFIFNLGLVLTAAGHFEEAARTLALLLIPTDRAPDIVNAYAVALKGAGRWREAEAALAKLLAAHPNFAGGHYNLGNLYLAAGAPTRAVAAFQRAYALSPGDAGIALNYAAALQAIGSTDAARALLEVQLAKHPGHAGVLNNLGNLARARGDLAAAADLLQRATDADPALADAAYNLGTVHADLNDMDGAAAAFATARRLRPDFLKAAWADALRLPQIYRSEDEKLAARRRWLDGLAEVTERRPADAELPAALAALAEITPFALAYQGGDDTAAMTRWGDFSAEIAGRALPHLTTPKPRPARSRMRVAFVSAHFRAHTVARLFGAWLTGLDRAAFEVVVVSTRGPGDAETLALTAAAEGHITQAMGLAELAGQVHDLAADVIVYPDLGMDPWSGVLAALPLAGRQLMSWGHPVSSGLPTIDAFLSADAMEPPAAAAHYRERLIRLPGLSIRYPRPSIPGGDDVPVHDFLCAQSLFKIPPRQDQVFAEILHQCPGRRLSFFAHPIAAVTAAFRARLAGALTACGLDPDAVLTFLPPCDRATFLRHLRGAWVILDTFDWSGGNTSLEALAMETPTVTLPGTMMRGRHTMAMLQIMGMENLIAGDEDAYVAIACDLMAAPKRRADLARQIAETAGRLFDDPAPIAALNRILSAP